MKIINILTLFALIFFSNTVCGQNIDNFKRQSQQMHQEMQRQRFDQRMNQHLGMDQMQQLENTDNHISKRSQKRIYGQLEALKNGVLIFRLKTNDKALKKLEGILNNPNTRESNKKRIREKTMPDLKSSAETLNNKLIRAFAEKYDFSAVYFMPDICTNALQNNHTLTCLTDAEGNPVSADVLQNKTIFLADFSELENDTTTRIKGLIISDKNADRLMSPFPYFQRSGGVFTKLSSNTITPKDALKMVERWNKKLHDFFEEK